MANIQVRVNDDLRIQAQAVASSMGLDLPSAVRLFLTQMVRENGLPFQPKADPFYSSSNLKQLSKSIEQMEKGETITKTFEELKEFE